MSVGRKLWSLGSKFGLALAISYLMGQAGVGIADAGEFDGDKPVNFPTYETHGDAVRPLCFLETGDWDVVKAAPKVVAANVIVMKNDGHIVYMDTTEAWDRARSKTDADNVWVIGVCEGDIVNR